MNKYAKLTALFVAILLVGCTTTPAVKQTSAMADARPRSILIIPVMNESVEVRAADSVLATLPKILAEKGYYVFPVTTVKTLLEHEGFYEPAEVHATPPEQLASLFGADAILYVTVHQWTAQYILLQTTTVVDLEYRIVNHDGQQLWAARKKLTHTPKNSDTGSLMGNLLVSAVSAALERADPEYLPLTRQANQEAFHSDSVSIPPGPYATNYDDFYLAYDAQ